jgi:DNA-binding NarL/FixJ family response regulator
LRIAQVPRAKAQGARARQSPTHTAEEIVAELSELGFEVEWASNGIDGLDKARALHPDVLIVDRMLPGMDGLTIIEAWRMEQVSTPAGPGAERARRRRRSGAGLAKRWR